MNGFKTLAATGLLALGLAASAQAQSYPVDQIHITVPFPAGGTTDILARELAGPLGEELGATVIVENRPGAGGTVGSNYVAHANADGSQLLLTATHHVINPGLRDNLPYDTMEDFSEVALIALVPNALVVHPDVPANSVAELIELAKEDPDGLNFGSSGVGGSNHLSGELFKSMTGIDMLHVPYPGAAPAMTDLLGGHIPVMFDSLPTVVPHVQSGKLRILGVTTAERVSSLPDVPTIAEAGVPGYAAASWFGLYGPAGLPEDARTSLDAALTKLLGSEEIATTFKKLNVEPGELVGSDFETFVADEIEKWQGVVESAGVELQ